MNKTSNKRRIAIILVLGLFEVLYLLPYLRWNFFDAALSASGLDAMQFAGTMSIFGVTSLIFYAPGGYFADRFSPRLMLAIAGVATGILGLWYATSPEYWAQMLIYALWGILITGLMWSARMKVANSLGQEDEQGRLFGFLEGSRGVFNTIISLVALWFFAQLGASVFGVNAIITALSILCFVAAALAWFIVPKELEGSAGSDIHLRDIGKVLKIPMVWMNALVVLSCYSIWIGSTYLTPYMTSVLGLGAAVAAFIGILRSYVLQLICGPAGGIIADKIGSVPKVIVWMFAVLVIALAIFVVLPGDPSSLAIALVVMLLFTAAIFVMRGIYFAPIDSAGVPKNLAGTAIGVISVIGFLPDVYMNAIAGFMQQNYEAVTAYHNIFIVMLVFGIVGIIASFIMSRMLKNRTKAAQQDSVEQ